MRFFFSFALLLSLALFFTTPAAAQVLNRREIEGAIDMRLRAALEENGRGLYVVSFNAPAEAKVPDGEITWVLGAGIENWEAGRNNLPVTLLVDGATAARLQVTVQLKQRVQTPVLRRDYKRGELVNKDDVVIHEIDLTTPLAGRLQNIPGIVGRVATRDIKAGQPLVDKMLEGPVAVERNDRVRITLTRGPMIIETTGIAMQRGRIGDFISIRNPQSKSLFEAQITAPGEAQVRSW
ncbi:flagellar basal body P-ring formation chaperone FlgA [Candidatus Magnetaquicoccus inordinatus]|uniref:flagellar basal body P-ring formation chaperone FlgA n=1 Tax=Candidatus Magnetaquicoccus inordinatus TaxID=2496818 RepID=UPI00102CBE7C|nr:flagellar basal body P-ring formation chaperone FlgA [Candidatus Magnetaquicoccus inordinatus]